MVKGFEILFAVLGGCAALLGLFHIAPHDITYPIAILFVGALFVVRGVVAYRQNNQQNLKYAVMGAVISVVGLLAIWSRTQ